MSAIRLRSTNGVEIRIDDETPQGDEPIALSVVNGWVMLSIAEAEEVHAALGKAVAESRADLAGEVEAGVRSAGQSCADLMHERQESAAAVARHAGHRVYDLSTYDQSARTRADRIRSAVGDALAKIDDEAMADGEEPWMFERPVGAMSAQMPVQAIFHGPAAEPPPPAFGPLGANDGTCPCDHCHEQGAATHDEAVAKASIGRVPDLISEADGGDRCEAEVASTLCVEVLRTVDRNTLPEPMYRGKMRLHFNRHGAAPLVWTVAAVKEQKQVGAHAARGPLDVVLWEVSVAGIRCEAPVNTRYAPKATDDDEDGQPSAWLEVEGALTIAESGGFSCARITP